MGPTAFDTKFANKIITVTNPPLASSLSAPDQIVPGDRLFFKNIKDYKETRGNLKNVSNAFQGEQAVYLGGGQYCGFPFRTTFDVTELRKKMLKNYIAGHKDFEKWNGNISFIKWLIDNLPIDLTKEMPITSQSQINRNFTK